MIHGLVMLKVIILLQLLLGWMTLVISMLTWSVVILIGFNQSQYCIGFLSAALDLDQFIGTALSTYASLHQDAFISRSPFLHIRYFSLMCSSQTIPLWISVTDEGNHFVIPIVLFHLCLQRISPYKCCGVVGHIRFENIYFNNYFTRWSSDQVISSQICGSYLDSIMCSPIVSI
jgi:hypothetical protein